MYRKDFNDDLIVNINKATMDTYKGPPVEDQDLKFISYETGEEIPNPKSTGLSSRLGLNECCSSEDWWWTKRDVDWGHQITQGWQWPISADATAISFGPGIWEMAYWFKDKASSIHQKGFKS